MKQKSAGEKRLAPRFPVPVYVETFSESFLLGLLTNVSAQGMFVQTTEPKELGTQMELQFSLPETGGKVQLTAEVIWVNYPPTHPESQAYVQPGRPVQDNPGMGLRVLTMGPKSRASLEEYVRTMQKSGTS